MKRISKKPQQSSGTLAVTRDSKSGYLSLMMNNRERRIKTFNKTNSWWEKQITGASMLRQCSRHRLKNNPDGRIQGGQLAWTKLALVQNSSMQKPRVLCSKPISLQKKLDSELERMNNYLVNNTAWVKNLGKK